MYNYTPYGVGMSPYQQQLTQNRMEQLQGQYNNMYNQNVMQGQQQQNIQMLKVDQYPVTMKLKRL